MKLGTREYVRRFAMFGVMVWSLLSVVAVAQDAWICNGRYANRYHCTPSCPGLNNCRGGVSKVKLSYAKTIRSECQRCGGNCHDVGEDIEVPDVDLGSLLRDFAALSEQLNAAQQQIESLQSDSVLQSHHLRDLRLQIKRLQRDLDSISVLRKNETKAQEAAVSSANASKQLYDSLAIANARATAEQLLINQTVQPERLSFELCLGAGSNLASNESNQGSFAIESGLLYRFDVDPYNVVQTPKRGNRIGVQYSYCHEFAGWIREPNAGAHHELACVLEFREWFRIGLGAVLGQQNSSAMKDVDRFINIELRFSRYPVPVGIGVKMYGGQGFGKTQVQLGLKIGLGFNFLRL